jgi:GTP-binding protein
METLGLGLWALGFGLWAFGSGRSAGRNSDVARAFRPAIGAGRHLVRLLCFMSRTLTSASFVISGASARDFPTDGLPEIAMVGRSNVGKSTLINALVRKDIARTSATPGKTRLVNVYRIAAGPGAFYLIDLPGFGHASGGPKARDEFAALTAEYFGARRIAGLKARATREPEARATTDTMPRPADSGETSPLCGAILAIDARHPGLANDVEALHWLVKTGVPTLLVATKADKLSQSERAKLKRECEKTFGQPPLTVSALKGDGLDEIWKRIIAMTAA